MITAEFTRKIDTLSSDEFQMVEVYVDNILEYSRRRKKEMAWSKIQSDLKESEKRMSLEGGISSQQLRKNFFFLGGGYNMYQIIYAPIVQEKLASLKVRLIELCGETTGEKPFSAVIDDFETRLTFSNTGIPIKTIYDVEKEFESIT